MTTQRADPHARREAVQAVHAARNDAQAVRLSAALAPYDKRSAAQVRLLREALKR